MNTTSLLEKASRWSYESKDDRDAARLFALLQRASFLGLRSTSVQTLVADAARYGSISKGERDSLLTTLDLVTNGVQANHSVPSVVGSLRDFKGIADKEAVLMLLKHELSNYALLNSDQGVDPILGTPYPPINYQLFAHPDPTIPGDPSQPRLTWTVPDVWIATDGDVSEASETLVFKFPLAAGSYKITLYITNYDWPDWAVGTGYIRNSAVTYGGLHYRSLQDGNTGHQPDTSPSWWIEDDTIFELYQFGESGFEQVFPGDVFPNEPTQGVTPPVGLVPWYGFDWETGGGFPAFVIKYAEAAAPFDGVFQIRAVAGTDTVSSQNIAVSFP